MGQSTVSGHYRKMATYHPPEKLSSQDKMFLAFISLVSRFRDLRSKTLAFKKRIAIISCVLEASLGARACVQVLCVQKPRRFAFAFLSPLSSYRYAIAIS